MTRPPSREAAVTHGEPTASTSSRSLVRGRIGNAPRSAVAPRSELTSSSTRPFPTSQSCTRLRDDFTRSYVPVKYRFSGAESDQFGSYSAVVKSLTKPPLSADRSPEAATRRGRTALVDLFAGLSSLEAPIGRGETGRRILHGHAHHHLHIIEHHDGEVIFGRNRVGLPRANSSSESNT
jgi:hypothetical protein